MSASKKLGLLVLTAAIIVGAFLLLKPQEKQSTSKDQRPSVQATTRKSNENSTAHTTKQSPTSATSNDSRNSAEKSVESLPLLEAGTVKTITVHKGDTVAFQAWSRVPEEVHVHGYDILNELPPGKKITVEFKATQEGVFEIELERSSTLLAKVKVLP